LGASFSRPRGPAGEAVNFPFLSMAILRYDKAMAKKRWSVLIPTGLYEGGGPMQAVRGFLEKHRNFAPDRTREKFLLKFFPQGYLKRIS
jgi:hypothetical protein